MVRSIYIYIHELASLELLGHPLLATGHLLAGVRNETLLVPAFRVSSTTPCEEKLRGYMSLEPLGDRFEMVVETEDNMIRSGQLKPVRTPPNG